jgi:hypothetical protein
MAIATARLTGLLFIFAQCAQAHTRGVEIVVELAARLFLQKGLRRGCQIANEIRVYQPRK